MKRLRHLLEYLLLRSLLFVVDHLPLRGAVALASGFADLGFRLGRKRRRVAIENIEQSGIATGAAAIALARESALHFSSVLIESLRAERLLVKEAVSFEIPDGVREILEDPDQGVLLVSGHHGNWEIGAQAFSRMKPVVAAARRVSNPFVDRLLHRRKPAENFRLVPEWFGSPTRFTDALKSGNAVAMLIDLDARGEGRKISFFGRPAATHVTVPMLHLVTKCPMVFVTCVRSEPGRFRAVFSEVISRPPSGDKEQDIRGILEDLNHRLEAAIRSHPAQYLWAHSRWKYGEWEPPEGFVPVSGRLGRHLGQEPDFGTESRPKSR